MNSKDYRENLIFIKSLINNNQYQKALPFVNIIIKNSATFFSYFIYKKFFIEALKFKLIILFELDKKEEFIHFIIKYRKFLPYFEPQFLKIKKIFDEKNFYDRLVFQTYLLKYPYDQKWLNKYAQRIMEGDDITKKDLPIFIRFCLNNRKKTEINAYTLKKLFKFKYFNLKFVTIGLNLFYNSIKSDNAQNPELKESLSEKDKKEINRLIIDYVNIIIKKKYCHRKIFYPLLKYYYFNNNDKKILPVLFKIIKKNKIHDKFSHDIIYNLYQKTKHIDYLTVLAQIKRNNNEKDEKAVETYTTLYKLDPKDIENTKFLVNVLQVNNKISSENIHIFLNAYNLFEKKEKNNQEFKTLIKFLASYLEKNQEFNLKFKPVVEDILRLLPDDNSFLYCTQFFLNNPKKNTPFSFPYDTAYFLISRVFPEKLSHELKEKYYYIFIKIFFKHSFYKSFMEFDWKKVYFYLKKLKKSSKYNVDLEIAQYYILRKNKSNLPFCFHSLDECDKWTENCNVMNNLKKIKSNLLYREKKIIFNYLKKASHSDEGILMRSIMDEDNYYIPLIKNIPLSYCANIQKLIENKKYEHAYETINNNPETFNYRGFKFWAAIILYYLKRYDESIIWLNKVIKENKKNPYAYFFRGMNFYKKNMFFTGLSDLNTAVSLNLYNRDLLSQIIKIFISKKKFNEASKLVDKLEKLDENSTKAKYLRAEIFFNCQKLDEALQILKELFNKTENINSEIFMLEIKIYKKKRELKKALNKCMHFIEKFGNQNFEIFQIRAEINNELKEFRLVKNDLLKIPKHKLALENFYILANASFQCNDIDEASEYLEIYRKNKPFSIKSRLLLSKIYIRQNLNNEALKILKITWLFSKNKEVLEELIKINFKIDKKKLSCEYCCKYLKKYGFNNEVLQIYLSILIDEKILHELSVETKKYIQNYPVFDIKTLQITYQALFLCGNFKNFLYLWEKKGLCQDYDIREIKNNKNGRLVYFLKETSNKKFNIYIFRGDLFLNRINNTSFDNSYFIDKIDFIFLYTEKNDYSAKLKYFTETVYNLNLMLFVFYKKIRNDFFFDNIKKEFPLLKNNIKNLNKRQKAFFLELDIFDSNLIDYFEMSSEHLEITYPPVKKQKSHSSDLEVQIAGEVVEEKKIFCNMKLDFFKEFIRLSKDFEGKNEFFLICFWNVFPGKLPQKIKKNDNLNTFNHRYINFFLHNINCSFFFDCSYCCEIRENLFNNNLSVNNAQYFNLLQNNFTKIRINRINRDIKNHILEKMNFFPLETLINYQKTSCEIFNETERYFKYNKEISELIKSFNNFNFKIADDMNNLLSLLNLYKNRFFYNLNSNKKLNIIISRLLLNYDKLTEKLYKIINILINEDSFTIDFFKWYKFFIEKFFEVISSIYKGDNFALIYYDNELFIYYVKKFNQVQISIKEDNEFDENFYKLMEAKYKNIEIINKKRTDEIKDNYIIKSNNADRIFSSVLKENTGFFVNSKEMFLDFSKSLNYLYSLKHNYYYFKFWDIRDILCLNIKIRELINKKSLIIWPGMKFFDSTFYSCTFEKIDNKFSSIFVSDINYIKKLEEEFAHIYFIDYKDIYYGFDKGLKYQKIFINGEFQTEKEGKFQWLNKKFNMETINIKSQNTEKLPDELIDIKENSLEEKNIFYNKYLNGKIKHVSIEKNIRDDFFCMTGRDFILYKK
ncbi:MAG: tetratricopeptide repeat protein [Candidatus Muiribacteriota bacterium]